MRYKVYFFVLVILVFILLMGYVSKPGNAVAVMSDGTQVVFDYPVKELKDVHPSLKHHECCEEWVKIQASIREAERFMTNHQMHLIFPGDWSAEFKADYDYHKKWITVRDKINLAKGHD